MISYGRQNIVKSDINAVTKCLKSDLITQGDLPVKFEKLLSGYLGFKYCTTVSNGTSGMFLIAKLLNWKKGDLIAMPAVTFISTASITEFCGAKPLFIDINLTNYCIDTFKLESKLKKGLNIKSVVVTDYGGSAANWKHLLKLKKSYKFDLINDQCHALGTEYYSSKQYSSKYSDFSVLSFHPVKAITTSEGGAVLTNSKLYDKKIKLMRSHGIERGKDHWKYQVNYTGFNFRLSDLCCSLGISQFKRINKFIKKRRSIAKIYDNYFKSNEYLSTPYLSKENISSYHLYPIRINFEKIKKNKDQLINFLMKKKIKLQFHYIPIFEFNYFKKKYKLKLKNYPNTKKFYNQVVSLPIYFELTTKKLKSILNNIDIFLKK
tara:strand:+ start:376 stop:1506 length:1131 start_codon:yes stop_codon:yes gene_type:complete